MDFLSRTDLRVANFNFGETVHSYCFAILLMLIGCKDIVKFNIHDIHTLLILYLNFTRDQIKIFHGSNYAKRKNL